MVETTKKRNKLLTKKIDYIHETNLVIEQKHTKSCEFFFCSQLDYFKIRNKQILKTQNNMVVAIVGLTRVMALHILELWI
jgi:hypothetical protein